MSNFITISDKTSPKSRLSALIKESNVLKFLVGFFHFTGVSELIESLKTNSLSDRKALDEIVFKAIGVTGQDVEALYAGLIDLTANRLRIANTFTKGI